MTLYIENDILQLIYFKETKYNNLQKKKQGKKI
jgi:hypothetical protein